MRLCRFDDDRIGLVRGTQVHDVTHVVERLGPYRYPLPRHDVLVASLPGLRPELERAADAVAGKPLGDVALLSPVANPGKLIGAPVNYAAHEAEGAADAGINFGKQVAKIREIALFLKANSALAGPSEGIEIRYPEKRTDHEVELAAVIGRRADRVPVADALSFVAGYTIGLDITTRGPEDRSFRKSSDGFAVLGPWLVTADEIGSPDALDLDLHVNGECRQRANTKDLLVGVADLIAWASENYVLEPGDVIFTGTPEGVGPLAAGDRLVARIDGIGTMTVDVR
jgi:2,4-didehydro-3-deoxy-L-rhamnonate hydrolase